MSNKGVNMKIATQMMDKNSEDEDGNGPTEETAPALNTTTGEVKDRNGQVIERHVVNYDHLNIQCNEETRTNIFKRP